MRLLVFDALSGAHVDARADALAHHVPSGSLVVVNDAATLPASLFGTTERGAVLEVRLLHAPHAGTAQAVLFGRGDYRTPTELRAPPPRVAVGDRLRLGALCARVLAVSPLSARLVTLQLEPSRPARGESRGVQALHARSSGGSAAAALWAALYAAGRPVQYAHQRELSLAALQTAYAGPPFAAEMPSAGRPLSAAILLSLRRRRVELAHLTHAAGLSATGDPTLDRALPFPEHYVIPEATTLAIARARREGRPVLAVGTSVVRALEGSAAAHGGRVVAGAATTALLVDGAHRLRVASALLSGIHATGESHHRLLEAFVSPARLAGLDALVERGAYHNHELGDLCLLVGSIPGA